MSFALLYSFKGDQTLAPNRDLGAAYHDCMGDPNALKMNVAKRFFD
jgi:hypothetical protein